MTELRSPFTVARSPAGLQSGVPMTVAVALGWGIGAAVGLAAVELEGLALG